MTRKSSTLCVAAALLAALPLSSVCAKPQHYTQGTTQLSGENAQLGVVYTVGHTRPFNITLRKAEYSVDPIVIGDKMYTVNAKQKFLVLHMTYHNPEHNDVFVRWDTFTFTVVDPDDQNHVGLIDLAAEGTRDAVSMNFKPAQKKDVFAAIVVPSDQQMPKLIITGSDNRVLRYTLTGKVKPVPAPFADPADKSGATALAEITGTAGVYYPVDALDFKLDSAQLSTEKQIGDIRAGDKQIYVVGFTLRNHGPGSYFFRWDSFQNDLMDADGVKITSSSDVYRKSSDVGFSDNILAGQTLSLRYLFVIDQGLTPKSLKIGRGDNRTITFDLATAK